MREISIFISYAREDHSQASKVRDFLLNNSFHAWMDTYDILPGEKWDHKILEGLHGADFILLCLSNNSVTKRGYLQKEVKQAVELSKNMLDTDIYLIPVRFDNCVIPRSISEYQWVDLFESEGFDRLHSAIYEGAKRRGLNTNSVSKIQTSTVIKKNTDLSELGSNKLINFFLGKKEN